MRDEPGYPYLPDEYEKWIAVYFRNRLTSAYASMAATDAPDDMARLLQRADDALTAGDCAWPPASSAAA